MPLHSKGFTLIEILVVLIIISISGSMVFINIGRSSGEKQAKRFANEMVTLVKRSRGLAVDKNMPAGMMISSADRTMWIVSGPEENRHKGRTEIPKGIIIEGEGIKKFEETVYGILFFPDGSSTGGEIVINVKDRDFKAGFAVDAVTGVVSGLNYGDDY